MDEGKNGFVIETVVKGGKQYLVKPDGMLEEIVPFCVEESAIVDVSSIRSGEGSPIMEPRNDWRAGRECRFGLLA